MSVHIWSSFVISLRFEYALPADEIKLRSLSVSVKNNSASFRSRDVIGQVSLWLYLHHHLQIWNYLNFSVKCSFKWFHSEMNTCRSTAYTHINRPFMFFRCWSNWLSLTWCLVSQNGEQSTLNFLQPASKLYSTRDIKYQVLTMCGVFGYKNIIVSWLIDNRGCDQLRLM